MLRKDRQLVFVPQQDGQSYLPPSFNCYPPIPDPPSGDPPGGGGAGSNPPGGDCYLAAVYQQIWSCGGYPPDDPRAQFPCVLTTLLVGYVRVCP